MLGARPILDPVTPSAGALRARHSLRPLISLGGWFLQTSDVSRRENAESCFGNWGNVIASSGSDEAIHSSFARRYGLPRGACHPEARSLSSGAHSRDPLARNDGRLKMQPEIAGSASA